LLLTLAAAVITPAIAHITYESSEAQVGAGYKAVLRVPHGCGESPTTAIRVKIPEGVIGVKPMPKPGWILTTATGKYPKTCKLFNAEVKEGVTEIDWSGGKLPDVWYDEFVFTGFLSGDLEPGKKLTFQSCRNAKRACTG
jgi:periplasmic copper chaperone A